MIINDMQKRFDYYYLSLSLCNLVRKKILAACSKCDVYGALKKFEVVLIIFKNEIKKKIRMQWINIP